MQRGGGVLKRVSRLSGNYGSVREVEVRMKTEDGGLREGLFSEDIIQNQGRKYFLAVMIDITDRKQAELNREKIIEELQSAIQQIKTLRCIMPICANCKKIGDDKGCWERVEVYVSKHTEAQFIHSLCPEYAKKFYPDLTG